MTHIVAAASPSDNAFQSTQLCMQYVQKARNITNKVQVNLDESDFVAAELRGEISHLRDKVVEKVPSREDVNRLEILLADLKYVKLQSWDEKIKRTASLEQERHLNLGNRVNQFVMMQTVLNARC